MVKNTTEQAAPALSGDRAGLAGTLWRWRGWCVDGLERVHLIRCAGLDRHHEVDAWLAIGVLLEDEGHRRREPAQRGIDGHVAGHRAGIIQERAKLGIVRAGHDVQAIIPQQKPYWAQVGIGKPPQVRRHYYRVDLAEVGYEVGASLS